jgi:hypothetical protein
MKTVYACILILSLALGACSDDTDTTKDKGTPVDSSVADKAKAVDQSTATCGTKKLLPADGTVGDFKLDKVEAAADAKGLQALINGGSEKYEKNKFTCMVKATFKSASKKHGIEIWLFDQTDAAGATAAYDASKHPDDADISPTIGDASRENAKLLFEYTADMRLGKYLARVKIDDKAAKADGPTTLSAMEKTIKAAK